MSVKARIGLLVESQGATRAASDLDRVARSENRVGDEAERAGRKMRGARAGATALMGGLHGLASATALGAVGAVGLATAFGVKAVGAWEESRKVGAATAQVIKSTGGAAHVTASEVANLAGELSGKTGVDDEAIQSGANMLLTFKAIRNEAGAGNKVFNQSVATLTDLAVAMGTDPQRAAIQLGKALNDPVKGVTALTKVGVTFDAQQKKTIESLVEQGDVMGAQKIILKELNSEFGGQAKAQGTALDKLKVSWGNVEEAVGSGLQPVTDVLFKKLTDGLDEVTPLIETVGEDFSRIFGRDDLDFTQKLGMSARKAQRRVRPLAKAWGDEFRDFLGREDFGDTLGDAFDNAAPVLANHAAAAAPKVASAFLHAWLGADIWGKLFVAALIAKKLGGFATAGRMAAPVFGRAFGPLAGAAAIASITMWLTETSAVQDTAKWLADKITGTSQERIQAELAAARGQTRHAAQDLANNSGGSVTFSAPDGKGGGSAVTVKPTRDVPTLNIDTGEETPGKKKHKFMTPGQLTVAADGGILSDDAGSGRSVATKIGGGTMSIDRGDLDYLAASIAKAVNDKTVTIGREKLTREVSRTAKREAARKAGV